MKDLLVNKPSPKGRGFTLLKILKSWYETELAKFDEQDFVY